jgi:hypothetical protein
LLNISTRIKAIEISGELGPVAQWFFDGAQWLIRATHDTSLYHYHWTAPSFRRFWTQRLGVSLVNSRAKVGIVVARRASPAWRHHCKWWCRAQIDLAFLWRVHGQGCAQLHALPTVVKSVSPRVCQTPRIKVRTWIMAPDLLPCLLQLYKF